MNRVFSSTALLLLVWGGDPRPVPLTLRVLTYNIHHGEGTDGRLDLSRLATVMTSVHPDLVALQEVDEGTERTSGVNELDELAHLTSLHPAFGKSMDYRGGEYGVAVLSRWPVLQTRNDPLPNLADREPRTALTVEVAVGAGGPHIGFTCTHLDQGRDPENRLAQVRYLNDRLVRDDGLAAILAGDLNARPDTPIMEELQGSWANPPAVDPSPIGPTGRPRLRVDYVLIRPAARWRVIESIIVDEPVASDHRPLLVVLEWTGPR
ncbi:MAG: endonuclease/exonuclease/phosphatase family protein [Vicinamibacterales bacterium]